MANRRRVFQIAEKIRNVVATELISLADRRFTLVTITSVVVSPDLRQAKVYWVVSGDEERHSEVEEAFDSATGHFKRVIGRALGIKFVPEVKYFYDDTLDATAEVEKLFARIYLLLFAKFWVKGLPGILFEKVPPALLHWPIQFRKSKNHTRLPTPKFYLCL